MNVIIHLGPLRAIRKDKTCSNRMGSTQNPQLLKFLNRLEHINTLDKSYIGVAMSSHKDLASTEIKEFNSVAEFIKDIDEDIAELRRRMGDLLKKLEELRIKAEQEKKIKELLGKLGVKSEVVTNTVSLRGLTLIFNPTAEQEQTALEVAVENLNNKLTTLQTLRRELEVVGGVELITKIRVIYVDGVPRAAMFRF